MTTPNTTPVSTKPGIDYPDTLEKVLARLDAGTWDPTLIYEAAKRLRSLSATPAPSVPLGGGEDDALHIKVMYLDEDTPPFIFWCHGRVGGGVLGEIEADIAERPEDILDKGFGDYEFKVTRDPGQYGEYGMCEISPYWDFTEISFTPHVEGAAAFPLTPSHPLQAQDAAPVGPTDEDLWELRRQAKADPRCADQHWFILFARAAIAASKPVPWMTGGEGAEGKFRDLIEQYVQYRKERVNGPEPELEQVKRDLDAAICALFSAAPVPAGVQGDAARLTKKQEHDLLVGEAIERAAKELPLGCYVDISIEQGAGSVTWSDGKGVTTSVLDGEAFHFDINTAIDAAIASQAGKD
jgi:hypothetical protein